MLRLLLLGMSLLAVSSCSLLDQNPETHKESVCKTLRYRMSYGYATSNGDRPGWQQTAEMDRLKKSYSDEGCKD